MSRGADRRSPTAGNQGQGGKWIRPTTRARIYARDRHQCVWCCKTVTPKVDASLDHVLPRTKGGTNAPSNLITSCLDCNAERGDRSCVDYAYDVSRDDLPWLVLDRVITAMATPLPAPVRQLREAQSAAGAA